MNRRRFLAFLGGAAVVPVLGPHMLLAERPKLFPGASPVWGIYEPVAFFPADPQADKAVLRYGARFLGKPVEEIVTRGWQMRLVRTIDREPWQVRGMDRAHADMRGTLRMDGTGGMSVIDFKEWWEKRV